MKLFQQRTVDSIVAGLDKMVAQLERHAIEMDAQATDHLTHAVRRKQLAEEAKAHSERAVVVAGKISALLN